MPKTDKKKGLRSETSDLEAAKVIYINIEILLILNFGLSLRSAGIAPEKRRCGP